MRGPAATFHASGFGSFANCSQFFELTLVVRVLLFHYAEQWPCLVSQQGGREIACFSSRILAQHIGPYLNNDG
jgi:hypothetical protein